MGRKRKNRAIDDPALEDYDLSFRLTLFKTEALEESHRNENVSVHEQPNEPHTMPLSGELGTKGGQKQRAEIFAECETIPERGTDQVEEAQDEIIVEQFIEQIARIISRPKPTKTKEATQGDGDEGSGIPAG